MKRLSAFLLILVIGIMAALSGCEKKAQEVVPQPAPQPAMTPPPAPAPVAPAAPAPAPVPAPEHAKPAKK